MQRFVLATALVFSSVLTMSCASDKQKTATSIMSDSAKADSISRARQDSINRAQPGYVVDSIFTPAEDIRRFRAAAPGDTSVAFKGGSASRADLVRRFIQAVSASDTADLQTMAVHAREFSDIYYPGSPYAHPPYRQPVAFAWRMIQQPSSSGLGKLLKRVGGTSMRFVGERCDPKVLHEGMVTRYAGCLVDIVDATGTKVTKRYYGSIVEYQGQFKFLSYTNDF